MSILLTQFYLSTLNTLPILLNKWKCQHWVQSSILTLKQPSKMLVDLIKFDLLTPSDMFTSPFLSFLYFTYYFPSLSFNVPNLSLFLLHSSPFLDLLHSLSLSHSFLSFFIRFSTLFSLFSFFSECGHFSSFSECCGHCWPSTLCCN